eukprot:gene11420-15304_t
MQSNGTASFVGTTSSHSNSTTTNQVINNKTNTFLPNNVGDTLAATASSSKVSSGVRFGVLVLLCCQNTGINLVSRYSQGILHEKYSSFELILMSELLKLFFSTIVTYHETWNQGHFGSGFHRLYWLATHSKSIMILVALYSIVNVITFYCLARIDLSLYTVLCQLKLFVTALFSVMLLHRNISMTKWRSLFSLVLGCILVLIPQKESNNLNNINNQQTDYLNLENNFDYYNFFMGVAATLLLVLLSGFSSVYFESILKNESESQAVTIWDLAFTLDYTDSLLKALASSGSVVLSALLGYGMLGASLNLASCVGCLITVLSILDYACDQTNIIVIKRHSDSDSSDIE